MSLYNQSDIILLQNNWSKIKEEIEQAQYEHLEPSKKEMQDVHRIILDFIKDNKRKIYGGFALNQLVKEKSPQDAFYKPDHIPDVDFYSPRPITDLMKLCNILYEKGYKTVVGREAQHIETYNITVNYLTYCDITYVPKNIYDRIPYKEVAGRLIAHPHFMYIDYLRMFTDPLTSSWRMGEDLKTFKRFYVLQKFFEFPYNKYPIKIEGSTKELDKTLKLIFDFIQNRKTILVVGFYAYNYFLKESNYRLDTIAIPYYEFISTNYRDDCLQLIDILKIHISITQVEYYPFFQFTDYSVDIFLGGDLVAKIYNHNKKCIPYQDVPTIDFSSGKQTRLSSTVRIATFHTVLMYSIISIMRARVQGNINDKCLYYAMTSHLVEMRKYYFKSTGKNMLSKSVFQEFTVGCIGTTMRPDRQRRMLIESRKKKNKRYIFSYEPAEGLKEPESNYQFANSSGNKILNSKHLLLGTYIKEEDIEGDFDEESTREKIEDRVEELPAENIPLEEECHVEMSTVV